MKMLLRISRTHFDANCTQSEVTDISAHSIKPSGHSEPSANLDRNIDGGHEVSKSTIFRLGRSDIFGCHNCKQRGDMSYMETHYCSRKK
jgi:hypothetical protein